MGRVREEPQPIDIFPILFDTTSRFPSLVWMKNQSVKLSIGARKSFQLSLLIPVSIRPTAGPRPPRPTL